ncbi:MAG TPA: hypothetical protein VGM88_24115 [Kofleriaceae bacterium]|jgi:hypothetical protein
MGKFGVMHGMAVCGVLAAVASVAFVPEEVPREKTADVTIVVCPLRIGPCYAYRCNDDGNNCSFVGLAQRPSGA